MTAATDGLAWAHQPRGVRAYVLVVIVAGALCAIELLPVQFPRPWLFAALLVAGCVTSTWKVNLPIPLASGSTLSVSYAADLMALLLLGAGSAMIVAVAGVWLQCTVRQARAYPAYRTLFSLAAETLTIAATASVYRALGGPIAPVDVPTIARPLAGAIAAYFIVNTGLVAVAIALTTNRRPWTVWRDEFQWSGASFFVAGGAGAVAAVVVQRGEPWLAALMLAPVYLAFRSYQLFVGRLDENRRHMAETQRLHQETIAALAQARAAERALADAHRVKDRFLAVVSHELRTPLNAVLGWSEMLLHGHLDPSRESRAFRAIYDGARRQSQLIEDLLDVSRIVSGKLRLTRNTIDLGEIVSAAVEVVQPAADSKCIHLASDVDPSVGSLYADGARLQQIAWNLLANAVKFTPEGGGVLIAVRRTGRIVELVVSDTGPGIPADLLTVIFEPFRQADESATRSHSGLGLGLAIVKHLVEAHGGTIRAENGARGVGATFIVRLPAVVADAGVNMTANSASPIPFSAALTGVRVLAVDDDAGSREIVAACLESHGAVVRCVESAAAAIEYLEREPVDLMIADIAMPEEDGHALIRRLRARHEARLADLPAIALTAFARPEDREQALRAGFQLHVPKPVERQVLVDAVLSVARLRAA